MKGRKRTPTPLALVKGNPGKRALPKSEPKPDVGAPARPEWLSESAAEVWDRLAPELVRLKVLTVADEIALALLCDAYAEFIAARQAVGGQAVYETETMQGTLMKRSHPAVAQASDAWRRVLAAASEFGLSPASRSKVTAAGDAQPADPWEALAGKR